MSLMSTRLLGNDAAGCVATASISRVQLQVPNVSTPCHERSPEFESASPRLYHVQPIAGSGPNVSVQVPVSCFAMVLLVVFAFAVKDRTEPT